MQRFKNLIMVGVVLAASVAASAQDVIVTMKGEKITVKVTEVEADVVKYKPYNNQDGAEVAINKSEVASIVYENGKVEIFRQKPMTGANRNPNAKLEIIALFVPDFIAFKPVKGVEFNDYSVYLVDGEKSFKAAKTNAVGVGIQYDGDGKIQTVYNAQSEIRVMNFDIPDNEHFVAKKIKFVLDDKEFYYNIEKSEWE
jgi:hypothetical protein